MATAESIAWSALLDAVNIAVPDVHERVIPPTAIDNLYEFRDALGRKLPASLLSLYECTDGIDLSGYLPDHYDLPTCTFSLIPVAEISSWHSTMLENHRSRGGLWPYFPHWLKTLTAHEEADGIWHENWIPFATDGAAGVQFVSTGIRRGVYQYSPETFGIRWCGGTISKYLTFVAARMKTGPMKALDLSKASTDG